MSAVTTERQLSTAKAISEAIAQEMERDPAVFVMGEDVATYGGIFGATGGLLDQFGPERVIDTPISETAFIGAGIGAATEGMRPIVELMFVDFFGVCMDQIYNHMAKIHYESGGAVKVPMVLMTAAGGGYSDGAQHSQCLWGTFAHLPGLKVVTPSNPYDAKGLMISAIRDDNPVLYLFHKGVMGLVWMKKNPRSIGPVPEEPYEVPIGKAAVAREGRDLSIVTLSLSVQHTLDAAEQLAGDGIDAEVVDLRSLKPLDRDTVLESVGKTGRLLVVDEDYKSFGMTGEIAATVAETDPGMLKAPVVRLAYPDIPVPYARPLEYFALPTTDKILAAARPARRRLIVGASMGLIAVRFPSMSKDDPDAEGIVGTWFVRDGQAVNAGQIIAEVQVEKVSQDVEAPTSGVIRLSVPEEAPVHQGDIIATIDT